MPLHFALAAKWLLAQSAGFLFSTVTRKLSEGMGLSPRPLSADDVDVLLDRYFHQFEERLAQRLIDRMDEDRLATLNGAIKQIKAAAAMTGLTELKKGYLIGSSNKFFDITSLPPQGRTGGFANAELICLAYLGIAAVHLEMHEPSVAIAQNIVAAVYAHPDSAKQWFGADFIQRLLAVCPQCGTENSPGAQYCQNDNYPLPVMSQSGWGDSVIVWSTVPLLPRYCSNGHPNQQGATTCDICAELIMHAYCRLGHSNPLGATFCNECGEPLASLF